MRRKRKISQQIIAIVLCMAMIISQVNIVNAEGSNNKAVSEQNESKEQNVSGQNENTEETAPEQTVDIQKNEETQDETTEDITSYYKDGKICIYNYSQLQRVGTGYQVYTGDKDGNIGSGSVVKNEGNELTYSADGQYLLMNDIEMNNDQIWTVADNFAGTITGEEVGTDEASTLYDKSSDTIYIYNPYQLMVLAQDDSENEPVMSCDYDAAKFGMGQMIYPDGENQPYLTYSKSHKYVLSVKFNSDKPELEAGQLRTTADTQTKDDTEGRDFKGQVVKKIGDKTYILIGNEEQLRKIGSGDTVYGAVYQAYLHAAKWYIDEDSDGKPIMLYGGDADLQKDQNGVENYTFGEKGIQETNKKSSKNSEHLYTWGRCGVNQTTGEIDPDLDIDKASGQTYSSTANYIIFRDIDLSSENWTPLMFQGTMIGAKSKNGEKLWNDDSSEITASEKPILSNVTVEQSEKLNVGDRMGVGFFATLSSEASADDIGVSKGLVKVSNLQFKNVSVNTATSETYYPSTLVSTLTSSLGKLLGGVLSGVTWLLTFGQVKIDLGKTLGDVLDARKKDPTALATGSIAGRIEGEVELSDIQENGVKVINVNNNTGGLVGYTTGITQYSGLSNALGDLVKLLTNILNVIPGLGLGDLITILLGNAIPIDKLIPTGYKNVKIVNCNITDLSGTLGSSDKDYAGGLVGQQIGTIIENCNITDSSYNVTAKNFAGGFTGLSRDDVIEGTLSGALDIETKLPGMNSESMILNSSMSGKSLVVTGDTYVGGFAGAMANTSAVNDTENVTDTFTVKATGNNVGGFAGIATLGWSANLGKGDTKDNLLGGVVDLVVKLLSSNPGATTSLLSLAGINPSYLLGCQVNGPLMVSGSDYVGGITGRGDGAYIAESTETYLKKSSYWKNGTYTVNQVTARPVTLNGLKEIKGKDCIGGIAGSLGTASVAGLLNTTLGVASYLAFTADTIVLTGADEGVKIEAAGERIGGAVGEAIGGNIKNTTVSNVSAITGDNMAGGFIGLSGPGDLAGTDGGLTVNLLGLNYVLKLSNLLSLGQAVEVQIENASVNGVNNGFTVKETGKRTDDSVTDYTASGFIARSNSTKVTNAKVNALKSVTAADNGGSAGGFVGISKTGGLAEVGDETEVKSLIQANGLLNAISYLIPSYTNCSVTYVSGGGVSGDTAGGFAGDFQSGTVNNQSAGEENYYSVYNLDYVNGQSYAGGFGGNVYSGALAQSGKGISILGGIKGLNINIGELVNLINAYIPYVEYAGVKSENGFTVTADKITTNDSKSGSAGGFIGYGSGVQVSNCNVTSLKHTIVTAPKNLEDTDGSSYFDTKKSEYAVTGARYAGGFIGYMDIGSAASVGKGLSVLGTTIGISDVLDALNVVVSTIEHSSVTGNTGGFSVKASMKNTESDASTDILGDAGGFAGKISGGHIQDSDSNNFSYIVGQITAGGYVGNLLPGNVADVLGDASILDGLVSVKESLASVAQDFVPTIRNSSTTCIPCGGAVRAEAASTKSVQRGMAGGYVGHNEGGNIWGLNTNKWKGKDYTGKTSTCEAVRIRSVYGAEIAGGFTGRMEAADTASAGSLSLLWGLVKADNILGALSIVYPTEENTAVYGPLAKMDYQSWNNWVEYVGEYGGYGSDLAKNGTVNSQSELDQMLAKYAYGYDVIAGRSQYRDETTLAEGGAAGGYVGSMHSGTITNGQAYQVKEITASRCVGGFAGEMVNGGAANLGGVSILELNLELGQMLNVLDVFVPVIKTSSVEGYRSGMKVKANGTDAKNISGDAGGYAGRMIGGQIWGDASNACQVTKLRRVDGTNYVGGFVGNAKPGSVASVNTDAGEDLLSKLINSLINAPTDLIKVLDATVTTIRYADVSSWDDWGIVINGAYADGSTNTSYATAAGGFAGSLSGTVLGKKDTQDSGVTVDGIRTIVAGEYAGGCFGIADVDAGVQVSGGDETSVLGSLLKLGKTDVLDAFRTYVYYGKVNGSRDAGLSVSANTAKKFGQNKQVTYSGNAGGFGGALLNSSVKNSTVTGLSNVTGRNSVGGFVGYSGKSGVVDLNKIDVLGNNAWQLLGGSLGVLDIFGSHVDNSQVSGVNGGYTVQSTGGEEQIAGGFIGYANLARMSGCTVGDVVTQTDGLKQVASGGTAGGFAGRTSYAYLADVQLDSTLVNALVSSVLNPLVKALYLDKAQAADLLNINLGILKIQALYEGNLVHVNLLGLDISVALSKPSKDNAQQTDFAVITIGDSTIKLPCDKNGIQADDDTKSNISVSLIKANRTKITDSKVYGISEGYDVYAGGADNDADGTASDGRSGGFVGYNDEGLLKNNEMYYCDVVRGTKNLVGPFSGESSLNSVYSFNTKEKVEGEDNSYRIYRKSDTALDEIKNSSAILNSTYENTSGWSIFKVDHMKNVKDYTDLKDATLASEDGTKTAELDAYASDAKAVLMGDTKTTLNTDDTRSNTPEPSEAQDPCDKLVNLTVNKVWKDFNNMDQKRPDKITITLSRSWTDSSGNIQTENVSGYENQVISGDTDKSTWQEVIKGLPAYKTDEDNTTIHYYTYKVTETKVEGYTTVMKTSDDGFTFTITNKHFALLPDTGGKGIMIFILAGILLLAIMLYTGYRKKKMQQAQERGNAAA